MKAKDFIKDVKDGKIDVVKNIKEVLKKVNNVDKEYGYFNTISEELALRQAKDLQIKIDKGDYNGKLLGLPVSIKDDLCVKNVECSCSSNILKNYKPVFNATVVEKIINEGGIIIGKTCQDEFGFGTFNVNVGKGFKIPKNPFDKKRACGGSSGGAAGITQKADFAHIAIGESTGGSIAAPSSFCGVNGLCPTYGLVSRYGLIDYSNSLDKVGPIGKYIDDVELMLNVIKGKDKNDSTSLNKELTKGKKVKKVALFKESLDVDKDISDKIIEKLNKSKVKYEKVSLPLTAKYGVYAYYIIAMSEASTNLAKYCGMRYGLQEDIKGNFDEYFSKVRSDGFSEESKRRIILGTFARMAGYRDAYYLKALKVRTLIINEYKKVLKKYDLIVSPTMPIIAPEFKDIEKLKPIEHYMMDVLTVGPNLAGLPHLSVNSGYVDKMPVGIMCVGDHLSENNLINFGKELEKVI